VRDNRIARLPSLWHFQQSEDVQDILSWLLVLLPIPPAAGVATFFTMFLTPFLGRPRLLFSPLVVAAMSSFAETESPLVFCFLLGGSAVASVLSEGAAMAALSRLPPALGLVSLFFSADPCTPVAAEVSFFLAWFGCTWRSNLATIALSPKRFLNSHWTFFLLSRLGHLFSWWHLLFIKVSTKIMRVSDGLGSGIP
jgi:hypothetical protein